MPWRNASGKALAGLAIFLGRSCFRVRGSSMTPALHDGDWLHAIPRAWAPRGFARGAVVVAQSPASDGHLWVKRVVGLPGELVAVTEGSEVLVNDVPLSEPYRQRTPDRAGPAGTGPRPARWWCDDDEYFLMGDNRAASDDSRRYGPLPFESILGRVWLHWSFRRPLPSRLGRAR